MKINWEYSTESEAKRIVQTAKQMVTGFYRLNGFYAIPFSKEKTLNNSNIVYLPELDYGKLPRFWEKVKMADIYHMTFTGNEELIVKLIEMISRLQLITPEMENIDNIWNQVEPELFKALEEVIPGSNKAFTKLTIHPTYFGTKCSFNIPEKYPCELEIYLRIDQDVIFGIVEAIVSALTKESVYKRLDGTWQESEMLVDWLITESTIGKVINKYRDLSLYQPTIKNTQTQQLGQISKLSDDFYNRLGLQTFNKPFTIKNNIPYHFGKEFENMTPHEQAVLTRLINNQNTLTTLDEISELISAKEENFSLYSITKTIQRIRDKFEQNGISGSFIQTMRGKGYVLKN